MSCMMELNTKLMSLRIRTKNLLTELRTVDLMLMSKNFGTDVSQDIESYTIKYHRHV